MNNYNYKQLLEMIIKDVPIKEDKNNYGISFIGPPGIGKSTVSKILDTLY
jgi:ABC-type polysaccharide/polyol phosphate transport system ATPase subunit